LVSAASRSLVTFFNRSRTTSRATPLAMASTSRSSCLAKPGITTLVRCSSSARRDSISLLSASFEARYDAKDSGVKVARSD